MDRGRDREKASVPGHAAGTEALTGALTDQMCQYATLNWSKLVFHMPFKKQEALRI